MLLILNLPLVGVFVNILRIRYGYLVPTILVVCICGVYGVNSASVDIVIVAASGVIGYLLRKFGFDLSPLILAVVLRDRIELSFRRALTISEGSLWIFVKSSFSQVFVAALVILIALQIIAWTDGFKVRSATEEPLKIPTISWGPPGFWSGTPLHQHDKDQPSAGESDHEEVYYHRLNWRKGEKDQFGSYAVQLLMDGKNLMKAYLIGEKSIFAIPGGCHPVVASPVSELLYLWGLAGKGGELVMRDIPEFVHLKTFEEIFKKLKADEQTKVMPRERLNALCSSTPLTEAQKNVLAAMLQEKGFDIE